MSNEDLLKERFVVIADYPGNNRMEGEIIPSPMDAYSQDEIDALLFTCKQFPKVFKQLHWWEERTIEEFPDYIKIVDENVIAKVEAHSIDIGFTYKETDYFISEHSRRKVYSTNTMPSCEEDFLSALANKEGLQE